MRPRPPGSPRRFGDVPSPCRYPAPCSQGPECVLPRRQRANSGFSAGLVPVGCPDSSPAVELCKPRAGRWKVVGNRLCGPRGRLPRGVIRGFRDGDGGAIGLRWAVAGVRLRFWNATAAAGRTRAAPPKMRNSYGLGCPGAAVPKALRMLSPCRAPAGADLAARRTRHAGARTGSKSPWRRDFGVRTVAPRRWGVCQLASEGRGEFCEFPQFNLPWGDSDIRVSYEESTVSASGAALYGSFTSRRIRRTQPGYRGVS